MTKARDLANVISGSGTLNANVIPALPASKITSGTFADARLSSSSVTQHVDLTSLSADNLTSGTVPSARLSLSASDIPNLATSKITSGTFADALFAASNITQHVDLSNLNASNLTSGSIPNARVPSGAVTQHVSAVNINVGTWSPSYSNFTASTQNADYVRVGRVVTATLYFRITNYSSTDSFMQVSGLPYTSLNAGNPMGVGSMSCSPAGVHVYVPNNSTSVYFRSNRGKKALGTADFEGTLRGHDAFSLGTPSQGSDGGYNMFTVSYISAS